MILTRYLYNKDLVLLSLNLSITNKNYDESLFWAYELYFSGFQQEVLDCLKEIYIRDFKENHMKLGLYITKKTAELDGKPELVATIIKNLTMKHGINIESPRVKFVNVKQHHITGYYTREPSEISDGIPNWKFLKEVCLFGVSGKSEKLVENWLFYAREAPVWQERLAEYNGLIVFDNEDNEEEFHNRYDYELDEQSIEIQKKCLGYCK
jgi:hypothetical protein